MQHTTLPGTNIRVSRIALGCMSLVPNDTYEGVDETRAIATVHAALDSGINFFDNAPAYGKGAAEIVLGKALEGRRSDAVIATKISGPRMGAADVVMECEDSLQRLGTDVIDLYQIHWMRRIVPLEETIRAMENLVSAGKVRVIGVCNFGPLDLNDLIPLTRCSTNQIAYNLLARANEFEVTGICQKNGIGLLCYSPVAQGLLAGKFNNAVEVPDLRARTRHFNTERKLARHGEPGCETLTFETINKLRTISERTDIPMANLALAWLLKQPAVTSVLVGASSPAQVQRNVDAAGIELSEGLVGELSTATDALKQHMGSNIDLWGAPEENRVR